MVCYDKAPSSFELTNTQTEDFEAALYDVNCLLNVTLNCFGEWISRFWVTEVWFLFWQLIAFELKQHDDIYSTGE